MARAARMAPLALPWVNVGRIQPPFCGLSSKFMRFMKSLFPVLFAGIVTMNRYHHSSHQTIGGQFSRWPRCQPLKQ
jgi:hypothetical protein